jgi:hypothetical protein
MLSNDILLRILAGGHICPDERQRMGITIHTVIQYNELVRILVNELNKTGVFPSNVDFAVLDVREGMYIVKTDKGYECRMHRYSPSNPKLVVEAKTIVFADIREVVNFYLKWELCLPGRLDGIEVR